MTTITFNPKRKRKPTVEDLLAPAMKIKTQKHADQYLKDYVAYLTKSRKKRPEIFKGMTPVEIAKFNLGYYAGYYDDETRSRVERLFKCAHPVFGEIKENGAVSPTTALELGKEKGRRAKKKLELVTEDCE